MDEELPQSLAGEYDDEEYVTDVLVSLADFTDLGTDEQFSMTDEDLASLLFHLEKRDISYAEFPAFVVQQSQTKFRTWTDNKNLKKQSQRDWAWQRDRVNKIAKGGKCGKAVGRSYKRMLFLEDVKKRTRCRRCHQK